MELGLSYLLIYLMADGIAVGLDVDISKELMELQLRFLLIYQKVVMELQLSYP